LLASPPPVRLVRALYDASAGMIADEIRAIEPGPRAALVVGHNPGVWALARMLAGAGMPGEMRGLEAGFRPGEFASIAFDADDWADVEPGAGRLLALFDPAGE
ncbi:MAG: histidine phosphatase family protein, partial [Hyphomicrobiales bacterium]|nr:histidine phosphatase family protein [Hyphomicrobiales bacterium]